MECSGLTCGGLSSTLGGKNDSYKVRIVATGTLRQRSRFILNSSCRLSAIVRFLLPAVLLHEQRQFSSRHWTQSGLHADIGMSVQRKTDVM